MKFKLIRSVILVVFAFIGMQIWAQPPVLDEYKAEVGLNGGSSYYLGEDNDVLFNHMSPSLSGFVRYRFNTRLALKAEFSSTNVVGNTLMNRLLYFGDVCGEFNFFDLEQNPYKRFSKPFSPYIFLGAGMITDIYTGQNAPEFYIPFGLGMKLKLAKRWNLNVQWCNRLLLADNLEGDTSPSISSKYNNPNNLNGTNILNNDVLSTFTIGISYDFWKKECSCLNINNHK
jgi:hypothetical protein